MVRVRPAGIAVVLLLFLCASWAQAHTVDPLRIELKGIGAKGTFVVTDQGNCRAKIKALVADPTIVSVSPDTEVTAVSQTFTVTALKGGTTKITIQWDAVECGTDVGSEQVTVEVESGPDLTLEKTYFYLGEDDPDGRNMGRRGGFGYFQFTVTNEGDQPATGDITIRDTLIPAFRYVQGSVCDLTESTVACDVTLEPPLLPGARKLVQTIAVVLLDEGLHGNRARVTASQAETDLSNNDSNLVVIDVLPPRAADRLPQPGPAKTNGRRH